MTIVSWLIDTSLPRIDAGAISAMYSGERFDARPIATPPSSRLATKIANDPASAVPSDERAKMHAGEDQQALPPEPVG